MTGEDLEGLCDRLCAEVLQDGCWLQTCGSLIRKPDVEHVRVEVAPVHGRRRCFCLDMVHRHAMPEVPGRMLALAPGGSCRGLACRKPDDDRRGRMVRLLRPKVDGHADVSPCAR